MATQTSEEEESSVWLTPQFRGVNSSLREIFNNV